MCGKPDSRPERLPTPLKAIRLKCIDCCGGSKREVRLCTAYCCPLHPFRMGTNPNRRRKRAEHGKNDSQAVRNERAEITPREGGKTSSDDGVANGSQP